jgi:microcystin-dependent protein
VSNPFVAEVRMFGFNFAPPGWATCDGQLLPIAQNTALFFLLGTMYAGDGKSTFGLPDLRGSTPIGAGQGSGLSPYGQGDLGGAETVTLLDSEIALHTHTFSASPQPAEERQPGGAYLANGQGVGMYDVNTQSTTTMAPNMTAPAGASLPHNNMQPYLTVLFCIALQGAFPARN